MYAPRPNLGDINLFSASSLLMEKVWIEDGWGDGGVDSAWTGASLSVKEKVDTAGETPRSRWA